MRVQVARRGGKEYGPAKRRVMELVRRRPELLRTVPVECVASVFEEEEDKVDYVLTLGKEGGGTGGEGFALLCDKQLASWVPPGWEWRYLSDAERRRRVRNGGREGETEYREAGTGRVVVDDLDEVWRGWDDDAVFRVRSMHILLLCAEKGKGELLVQRAERTARDLGIRSLSLGAANDELVELYRTKYGFAEDQVGCAGRSSEVRMLIKEWNRAHRESDGLYGTFMSRCLSAPRNARSVVPRQMRAVASARRLSSPRARLV